jgi:hypothetical protein
VGSAYHRIGRLATHPMFRMYGSGPLHCPFCDEGFRRVPEAEKHLLAHDDLTVDIAWRFLSGRTWEREQPKRGWPTTAEMLAAGRT